jgi:flagellar motor switch/type III secretory pathway protein FliN
MRRCGSKQGTIKDSTTRSKENRRGCWNIGGPSNSIISRGSSSHAGHSFMATQASAQPVSSPSSARVPLPGSQLGAQLGPQLGSGPASSGTRDRGSSPADTAQSHGDANASEAASSKGSLVATGSPSGNAIGASRDAGSEEQAGYLNLSPPQARLPVELQVMVPVREFRVRHLLAMAPGEVIETLWGHGEDLPLSSGDVQLAWSEFEVVDNRLAVRVTRLA